jgi:hypothetical protein
MANIDKIKPEQVLHDYHKYKMGNTTMRAMGHWTLTVIEIDLEKRRALCSWNSNKPSWYSERQLKKFRIQPKEPK